MSGPDDDLQEARRRVQAVYDPELLRTAGHRLADLLFEHFTQIEASQGCVLPWRHPQENIDEAEAVLHAAKPAVDRETLSAHFSRLVQLMLDRGHHLHDPRYVGHQVAASVPLAGLFDAVGAVTNQPMAIYDMGPWATAAEWVMVQELGRHAGFAPGTFSGLVTHGGSLANLTGLLTARNVTLADSWQKGMAAAGAPAMVVHNDVHYSVSRAAGILGLGTQSVFRTKLDAHRRIDPNALDELLGKLRREHRPVVAVVACACSTPIGAFDPLEDVAAVCRRHGVWLHVDAAHGGAACLSARHRRLVAGLAQAESVAWDAHKMLFMPALCAFVFYRTASHQFAAFQQDAPYLFDPSAPGLAQFDSGLKTVECTKRAAAFGLWGIWSLLGPGFFGDLVDITFSLGRTLYERLSTAADFTPLHEPQCNIVAFRHVPEALRDAPAEMLDRFQLDLRRRIIESGEFYLVSTKLDGQAALRVTLINPLTTPDHLDQLLETIRRHGQKLISRNEW